MALLVETIGDGDGGRFVDNREDRETHDGTGIPRGLTLSVAK